MKANRRRFPFEQHRHKDLHPLLVPWIRSVPHRTSAGWRRKPSFSLNTRILSPPPSPADELDEQRESDAEDDRSGRGKWTDAAWEVAVSVIGAVVSAGLVAVAVAVVHRMIKRRNIDSDEQATSSAGTIHIHNHVIPAKAKIGDEVEEL